MNKPTGRRAFGIALVVLAASFGAWMTIQEIRDFFGENRGVEFYSSHPKRLFYVVAITGVAGVVTLAYLRLSVGRQRTVRLAVLAAAASAASVFFCFMSVNLIHMLLTDLFFDSVLWLVFGICVLFLGFSVWLWFAFWHLLRRGTTRLL